MTTDTPRTDAWTTFNPVPGIEYTYASVARDLEKEADKLCRELAAARALIIALKIKVELHTASAS